MSGLIRSCKDNFWSRLRVERGIKIVELANLLGYSDSAVGTWFTGQIIPKPKVINDLCSFFDVDINDGTREFILAHREWKAQHSRPSVVKNPEATREKHVEVLKSADDLLSMLYGKVGYDTFNKIVDIVSNNSDNADILSCVYGSVSYDEYKMIIDFINQSKEE
jgi:transcriptional regulator with XRE-family HTH domain